MSNEYEAAYEEIGPSDGPVPNAPELGSGEQNLPKSGELVAAPVDEAASGSKKPALENQAKSQGPFRDDGVKLYSEKTGKSKTESSKRKKRTTESFEKSKPKKKKKPWANKTKWRAILILSTVVLIVSLAFAGLCAAHRWGEARVIAALAP